MVLFIYLVIGHEPLVHANRDNSQRQWSRVLLQGRSQDFSKGGSRRLLTPCSPSCISGLSRIIAAWRPILTKDKSRWRKYFTKKQILRKWAFQQWLLWPRYCHCVFATWILWAVCSKEGLPRGGHGHPRTPPSYAPAVDDFNSRFSVSWFTDHFLLKTGSWLRVLSHFLSEMKNFCDIFNHQQSDLLWCTFFSIPLQNTLHRVVKT